MCKSWKAGICRIFQTGRWVSLRCVSLPLLAQEKGFDCWEEVGGGNDLWLFAGFSQDKFLLFPTSHPSIQRQYKRFMGAYYWIPLTDNYIKSPLLTRNSEYKRQKEAKGGSEIMFVQ